MNNIYITLCIYYSSFPFAVQPRFLGSSSFRRRATDCRGSSSVPVPVPVPFPVPTGLGKGREGHFSPLTDPGAFQSLDCIGDPQCGAPAEATTLGTSFTPLTGGQTKASQSKDWEPLRGCYTRGSTTYLRCGLRGVTPALQANLGWPA